MSALDAVAGWPASEAAVAVADAGGVRAATGPLDRPFAWASVTKLLTALAVLVAVEEGTVALEEPARPPGSSVRHLLAHASGLGPEGGPPLARPGTRRVYSNAGYVFLAEHLAAAAAMSFDAYLHGAVLAPLTLTGTRLEGSPASGAVGTLRDLIALGRELLDPSQLAAATHAEATRPAFPDLAGVLPGFGRHDPNPWGLGPEIRGRKSPHWTGRANSPATFGHFGQAGGFLWVDPGAELACACLTDAGFGPWATAAWPALADAVLGEHAARP